MQSAFLLRVAVFVDYECIKGSPPARSGEIIQSIRSDIGSKGTIQLAKVYFAMGLPSDRSHIEEAKLFQAFEAGADPVPVPSFKGDGMISKNLADQSATVDIVDTFCMSIQRYPRTALQRTTRTFYRR
jgi:hypothetical protein